MKNLQKVTALVIAILIALSVNAFAMSQSDFVDYVSKDQVINGTTYHIKSSYRKILEDYLADHPITESQADEMKAKYDSFLAYIDSIKVRKIKNTTTSQRQTLLSKANEITSVVGVSVKYNATDKTIEFYDPNGKFIVAIPVSDYDLLVQTGSSNYGYLAIPAVAVVLAVAGVVIYKKRA